MGKFGKRKLPKFLELESTEALDENSNLSRNDRRAEIEALKAIGISTGNEPGTIIESYYRIEDLRTSGLENPPAKILWSDLWIKFIDIDYDEQIVNFKIVEDSIDMPTIYKILDVSAGINFSLLLLSMYSGIILFDLKFNFSLKILLTLTLNLSL